MTTTTKNAVADREKLAKRLEKARADLATARNREEASLARERDLRARRLAISMEQPEQLVDGLPKKGSELAKLDDEIETERRRDFGLDIAAAETVLAEAEAALVDIEKRSAVELAQSRLPDALASIEKVQECAAATVDALRAYGEVHREARDLAVRAMGRHGRDDLPRIDWISNLSRELGKLAEDGLPIPLPASMVETGRTPTMQRTRGGWSRPGHTHPDDVIEQPVGGHDA